MTDERYVYPEGTFQLGFRKQTVKEQVAEVCVRALNLPRNGQFVFHEYPDPKNNLAVYSIPDKNGNQRVIADFDALYIQKTYEALGLAQEQLNRWLPVAAATLNLVGAGVLWKAEIKGLASDIQVKARTNLALNESLAAKYTKNRPKHYQKNINEVWEKAKDADGRVYDPNTGEELTWDKFKSRYDQWHMGHKPGHEYRTLVERLRKGEITEEQFLKEYHNPNNYQPESPRANMSHQYEQRKEK